VPSDAATDIYSQMFLSSDIYTSRHGHVQIPPSVVSHLLDAGVDKTAIVWGWGGCH